MYEPCGWTRHLLCRVRWRGVTQTAPLWRISFVVPGVIINMVSRLLLVALVFTMVLAPASALAANNCVGMGADCDGPCGTVQGAVGESLILEGAQSLVSPVPHVVLQRPAAPVRALDPPPRLGFLAG